MSDLQDIVLDILIHGAYAVPCGAAISLIIPGMEWWRLGLSLFGATLLTRFMWAQCPVRR